MARKIVSWIAFAALLRGLVAWFTFHWDLTPDTSLYAQGGIGLYPSPVGRLLGAFGPTPLAIANSLAAMGCVLLAASIASSVGARPVAAALAAFFLPLGVWTLFNGVDALGAMFVLAAIYFGRKSYLAIGALTHTSLVPTFLLSMRRRYWLLLGCIIALVLLLTPYGGITHLHPVSSLAAGAGTVGIILLCTLPCLYGLYRTRQLWQPAAILLVSAFLAAAMQAGNDPTHTNARYGVPFSMLLAAVTVPA